METIYTEQDRQTQAQHTQSEAAQDDNHDQITPNEISNLANLNRKTLRLSEMISRTGGILNISRQYITTSFEFVKNTFLIAQLMT
jgi:hypothetical protein